MKFNKYYKVFVILIFTASLFGCSRGTGTIQDNVPTGNFTVGNVASLQSALNTAASNGRDDTIVVSSGTYNITTTLTYNSQENYSITIVGTGANTTIFNGGNAKQILKINTSDGNANVNIKNITFQNGKSSNNGAGLQIQAEKADVTIENSGFNDNSTTGIGGGVDVVANGAASVSNCFFRRNSADNDAGGLNISATNITLNNSTFEDNVVPGVDPGVPAKDAGGALLYVDDNNGQILVSGNIFNRNEAADGAGGCMIYVMSKDVSATVNNNSFSNNVAQLDGGGCFIRFNETGGKITYKNNSFSGNQAMANGGGTMIYLTDGTLDHSNNIYTSNTSSGDGGGGGAWIWNGTGSMNVSNNAFSSNNASAYNGGGAVISTEQGTINCSRNIFRANTSSNSGGGASFAITSGRLNLFNNTFYGNQAQDGGGAYLYFDQAGSSGTAYNNIFWNDTGGEVGMSGSSSITFTYSDIKNGTGETWFGIGCINSDPLFVNAGTGNFNLGSSSPCINKGDPSSYDPDGTRADMGAF